MNVPDPLDDRLEAYLAALDAGTPLEDVLSDLPADDRAEVESLLLLATAMRSLPDPAAAQTRPDFARVIGAPPTRQHKRRWFYWEPRVKGWLNFNSIFSNVYATGLAVAMIAILLGVIFIPRLLPIGNRVSSPGILGGLFGQKSTPTQVSVMAPSTPGVMPELEVRYGTGDAPNPAIARLGIGLPRQVTPSPDGKLLAIGTTTGVYMYDSVTMNQLWSESTYAAVEEIRWSADSRRVAARLYQWGNILVWNSATGEYVRSLEYDGEVFSMDWSPDRLQIAGGFFRPDPEGDGGYAFGVAIWQVNTGKVVVEKILGTESQSLPIEGDQPARPTGLDWSPVGGPIAVAVGEHSVALIDPASGNIDKILQGDASGEPLSVRFSPDGQWLAVYATSGTQVDVWRVSTGELAYELGHDALVLGLKWSPDGTRLATTTYGRIQTRVWDMASGTMLLSITAPAQDTSVFGWFDSLAWSADGERFIVTGQGSGGIVRWDLASGTATTMGFQVPDLASYSPVAYVGSAPDGSLTIWDSAAGVPRYSFRFTPPPQPIGWSADSKQVAGVAADQSTVVWDVESAQPVQFLDSPKRIEGWLTQPIDPRGFGCWDTVTAQNDRKGLTASAVSILDAGSQVGATVNILESDTTAMIYTWTVKGSAVCALSFSPNGKWLAIGQGNQSGTSGMRESAVTILDMETGQVADVYYGHTGSVLSIVWSPDGLWLASVSADGTVVVW